MDGFGSTELVLSGLSFVFTSYFWLVQARRERPRLQFYQLRDFRVVTRRHPNREGMKRLCVQQLGTGGVLIANHSTRQNSIVMFACHLKTPQGNIPGDWGFSGDDSPPWNVGPESAIAFSPACFFDVPEDFEVPENVQFEVRFITASGRRFSHTFTQLAPGLTAAEPLSQAA